jgi:hypothetical protein
MERMVDWMVGEGITPVDPAAKIRPDKSLVTANHAWLEVARVPSNIAQKSCGFLVVGREDDDTSRVNIGGCSTMSCR